MPRLYFLLALMYMFHVAEALAQSYNAPINKNGKYSKEILASKVILDTVGFKNLPLKSLPYWSLRSVAYNPLQSIYEKVLDGKSTIAQYTRFITVNKLDTTYVSKEKLPGNLVHLITAIDTMGIKYMVVDANNNLDFSDDRVYKFDLSKAEKSIEHIQAFITYFDGKKIKKGWISLDIDAVAPNKTNKKNLDISVSKILVNRSGSVEIEGKTYLLEIFNFDEIYRNSPFSIHIKKAEDKNKTSDYTYSSTGLLDIGYNSYSIDLTDSNKVRLNFVGKNSYLGAEIGSLAPPIEESDMLTGIHFSLKKQKDKYILLDFWGSWCNPCIALLPDLRTIYENFKNKIQVVSVAYDQIKNKDKLTKLIASHKMEWVHLFDEMDNNKSIIAKKYKVQIFPTTMLIDKNGKVVIRGTGKNGLIQIEEYLKSLTL